MAPVRRVVLDVLKPHDPPIQRFARRLADETGVAGTTATLVEIDREVQNVLITIEGDDLAIEDLEETIVDLGGTVHSIDQVSCGSRVIRPSPSAHDSPTPDKSGIE